MAAAPGHEGARLVEKGQSFLSLMICKKRIMERRRNTPAAAVPVQNCAGAPLLKPAATREASTRGPSTWLHIGMAPHFTELEKIIYKKC